MFISPAFATDVAAITPQEPSIFASIIPLVIIFILFYVLILRPQSKRIRAHADLLKALKAGDKVVTGGGLLGVITAVQDDHFVVEIAPNIQVRAQKHTIQSLQDQVVAAPVNDKNVNDKK